MWIHGVKCTSKKKKKHKPQKTKKKRNVKKNVQDRFTGEKPQRHSKQFPNRQQVDAMSLGRFK